MPKRKPYPGVYQYQVGTNDDAVTLAEQNGVTPAELIAANPGGFPLSVGQTVNIPPARTQYQTKIEANRLAQQQTIKGALNTFANVFRRDTPYPGIANAGEVRDPYPLYANNTVAPNISTRYPLYANNTGTITPHSPYPLYGLGVINMQNTTAADMRGRGTNRAAEYIPQYATSFNSPMAQAYAAQYGPQLSSVYGTDDSWATGTATATAPGAQPRPQPQTAPGMPISDNNYMTNPALYSLQWNSSAKNVKNRFNTNLKWAQNAWRRKAGRGMNARRRQEEQQKQQDFTLSNSLIHLGAGSG
jgi:hypothetical protein